MPDDKPQDLPESAERAKTIGCFLQAEVKGSFSHGARLKLDGLHEPGFLHVSQMKPGGLDVPISPVLCVGQRLSVQVTGFNKARSFWEVSRQAVLLHEKWLAKGPAVGDKCIAQVTRVTAPFGALMLLPTGIAAFSGIAKYPGLWEFMTATGRLSVGASLRVQINGWDKRGRGVSVDLDLGNPAQLQKDTVHEATVVHVVSRLSIRKTHGEELRQVIYGELSNREIVHAYANEYLFPEKHFSLGQKIIIRVVDGHRDNLARFYFPVVPCEIVNAPPIEKRIFKIGEEMVGRISKAVERFAICLLSDGIQGLIHHSSVIEECDFDTRKYLHPGDWVRVRIAGVRESEPSSRNPFYSLKFVALHAPGDMAPNRDPLVDLLAVRQKGKAGGYQRDAEFRRIVLDAFDFTCCVCGDRYCIAMGSPMEAAHIIPRSKRGAEVLANSLCFCPVHHWAFDRGFLAIDQDYFIKICDDILSLGEETDWLSKFDGLNAHLPDARKPDLKALAWHHENVFLK